MGFRNFIVKWLAKGFQPSPASPQQATEAPPVSTLDLANEYLQRSKKTHADTLKLAQTINNANLLNMQTKDLKDELKKGLEKETQEDEDYDDDEEEPEDLEDMLMRSISQPFIDKFKEKFSSSGSANDKNTHQSDYEPEGETRLIRPEGQEEPDIRKEALNRLNQLSDEDLKSLKARGFL